MCGEEPCDDCGEGNMQNISKTYKQQVQVWVCDSCGNLQAIGRPKGTRKEAYEELLFTVKVNPETVKMR